MSVENTSATVHVTKIAAAVRQLNAAIRMFFTKEDELAIHTVAAAAFRVLRDVTKKRGRDFHAEAVREGLFRMAQQYADGDLPPEQVKAMADTGFLQELESIGEAIKTCGEEYARENSTVPTSEGSKKRENKTWPSKPANFLKHADRDPDKLLSQEEIDNEMMLIGASAAYINLMNASTPEILAYCAFWAVKNDGVDDVGTEVYELVKRIEPLPESERYEPCLQFIREQKSAG
ncbi:MAG: hypothetical protein AB7O70_13445 [Hyphomicrobiales bacterium]